MLWMDFLPFSPCPFRRFSITFWSILVPRASHSPSRIVGKSPVFPPPAGPVCCFRLFGDEFNEAIFPSAVDFFSSGLSYPPINSQLFLPSGPFSSCSLAKLDFSFAKFP